MWQNIIQEFENIGIYLQDVTPPQALDSSAYATFKTLNGKSVMTFFHDGFITMRVGVPNSETYITYDHGKWTSAVIDQKTFEDLDEIFKALGYISPYMTPDNFEIHDEYEMDKKEANYAEVSDKLRKGREEAALKKIKEKIGDNPTPYDVRYNWGIVEGTAPLIYQLTANVIFKP